MDWTGLDLLRCEDCTVLHIILYAALILPQTNGMEFEFVVNRGIEELGARLGCCFDQKSESKNVRECRVHKS